MASAIRRGLGTGEGEALQTSLAVEGRAAASTQDWPWSALLFVYEEVQGAELPWLDGFPCTKAPARRTLSTTAPTRR